MAGVAAGKLKCVGDGQGSIAGKVDLVEFDMANFDSHGKPPRPSQVLRLSQPQQGPFRFMTTDGMLVKRT